MILLLKCVKERLHFEQVTVEFKLLHAHVKMFSAELLPFFVSLVLLLQCFVFPPSLFTNELSVAIVLFKPYMVVDISIMLDWHGTFFICYRCFVAELVVRTFKKMDVRHMGSFVVTELVVRSFNRMNVGHMGSGNKFRVNGLVPERNRLAVVAVVVGQFMMMAMMAVVLFHVLQLVFAGKLVLFVG